MTGGQLAFARRAATANGTDHVGPSLQLGAQNMHWQARAAQTGAADELVRMEGCAHDNC
jgi:hypothetical protein